MKVSRASLRVAAAQYPLDALPDVTAYADKIAHWVAEGAGAGAELLVFPEYGAMELAATRGPAIAGDLKASLAAVADLVSEQHAVHARLAGTHGVHILAGSGPLRQPDGTFVNAATLFAPSGASATQHKLIMTPFEKSWGISAGGALRVFQTALGRIGIAICYDAEFPLIVRAMAEAGAELVLVPACTERLSGYHRVRTAALARALENGIACVLSPTVGEAPWSPAVDINTGAAGCFVPAELGVSDTGVVAEGRVDEPGWIAAEIDLEQLRRLRLGGEMHNSADWVRQPGAGSPQARVEVVRLD